MRYYAAVLAVVIGVMLATPAQAAEADDQKCETKCRKIVVKSGDDDNLVALAEAEGCKVIAIGKDGEEKVIRLKDGKLLDLDDKLDTDTHLKLLDAKIAYLKSTGQLKNDLAIMRAEAEKLRLAEKPDAEIAAKKKEADALKSRLEHARQDYKQAVKKLVPEDMYELYMLGVGDETGLLELDLNLPAGSEKRIIKRIELRDDDEDSD